MKTIKQKRSNQRFSLNCFVPKQHKGLQMSFSWMFAIIVGAFILFLAIYASVKLISTEDEILSAKTSKQIGILLNPLETSFESAKTSSLIFPVVTRIYNKCNNNGYFGRQLIQVSQKSFNKWIQTDIDVGFSNKYVFSDLPVEGKTFYLFSKPFEFPFKVADVIIMTSSEQEYCFIDSPDEIENELSNLNLANVFVEECPANSVNVCFSSGSDCDISVSYGSNIVGKRGKTMYFEQDALMYAAIFSEPDVYECQLKRLMQRVVNLAGLYKDKSIFISRAGCSSDLGPDLLSLINSANNLETSANLGQVGYLAEDIQNKNELNSECRLW